MCLIIMFIILTVAVLFKEYSVCTTNPPMFCKAWHYFFLNSSGCNYANYKHTGFIQYYNSDTCISSNILINFTFFRLYCSYDTPRLAPYRCITLSF